MVMRTNDDTMEAGLAGVLHMQNGVWIYARYDVDGSVPIVAKYPDTDLLSVIQLVHKEAGGVL